MRSKGFACTHARRSLTRLDGTRLGKLYQVGHPRVNSSHIKTMSSKPCFQFQRSGQCRYGERCRYSHASPGYSYRPPPPPARPCSIRGCNQLTIGYMCDRCRSGQAPAPPQCYDCQQPLGTSHEQYYRRCHPCMTNLHQVPPPPPVGHVGPYVDPNWKPAPAPLPVTEKPSSVFDVKMFYNDQYDDPDTWNVVPEPYSPSRYDESVSTDKPMTGLDAMLMDEDE